MSMIAETELKITWLLDGWYRGLVSPAEVHHFAEQWMAKICLVDDIDRSLAVFEVLSQLDILNQQLIIRADIPEMLKFLDYAKTNPSEARDNWNKYWKSVDFKERAEMLSQSDFYAC